MEGGGGNGGLGEGIRERGSEEGKDWRGIRERVGRIGGIGEGKGREGSRGLRGKNKRKRGGVGLKGERQVKRAGRGNRGVSR